MAITSMIRLRMSAKDAHYGGNLVDGAHMVHLFGDVATELLIKRDGDEGLFAGYEDIKFLAPVTRVPILFEVLNFQRNYALSILILKS